MASPPSTKTPASRIRIPPRRRAGKKIAPIACPGRTRWAMVRPTTESTRPIIAAIAGPPPGMAAKTAAAVE
jgi:hypothetical protein